jgi:ferritin-like protein
MGSTGNFLIKGIDIQEIIIDALDSFHAQSWVVVHFSFGLKNRLEGQAAFLLSKELEEKAQESLKHAKKLAERIAELRGIETADPTEFVMLSPLKRFLCQAVPQMSKQFFRTSLSKNRQSLENMGTL